MVKKQYFLSYCQKTAHNKHNDKKQSEKNYEDEIWHQTWLCW